MSVVVSTKNSEKTIAECLGSLRKQTFKDFEVIVVDGSSTDNTRKIVSSFGVQLVDQPKGNLSVARNMGLAVARGDPVVFLDSDCVAPDNWLGKIAARFENQHIAVLGGPDSLPDSSGIWQKAFAFVDSRIGPMVYEWGPVERVHGCNVAYRMGALRDVRGFNEELDTAEETDVQKRIEQHGGTVIFDPDINVVHYKRENLRAYVKQHFWYGVGKGQWMRRDRRALKVSNVGAIAFLFIPVLLFLLLRSVGPGLLLWLLILGAGGMGAFVAAGGRQIRLLPYAVLTSVAWIYSESIGQILGLFGYSKN
jgi:glycosyltransferase involved in cell wall biosynthesis